MAGKWGKRSNGMKSIRRKRGRERKRSAMAAIDGKFKWKVFARQIKWLDNFPQQQKSGKREEEMFIKKQVKNEIVEEKKAIGWSLNGVFFYLKNNNNNETNMQIKMLLMILLLMIMMLVMAPHSSNKRA